jgi:hypothetical protein
LKRFGRKDELKRHSKVHKKAIGPVTESAYSTASPPELVASAFSPDVISPVSQASPLDWASHFVPTVLTPLEPNMLDSIFMKNTPVNPTSSLFDTLLTQDFVLFPTIPTTAPIGTQLPLFPDLVYE